MDTCVLLYTTRIKPARNDIVLMVLGQFSRPLIGPVMLLCLQQYHWTNQRAGKLA